MKTTPIIVLGAMVTVSVGAIEPLEDEPEFTEPGWFLSAERTVSQQEPFPRSAPPVFGDAPAAGSFGPSWVVTPPEIAEAVTPEIQALAEGLEKDPKRIFDYVHDHIRYVHYFGSKKGAELTLLERSGNDFDQCALLMALLRAAGHTADYHFGVVYLPYEQSNHRDFKHWLGLTKPETNIQEAVDFAVALSDSRGFPYVGAYYYWDGSDDLWLHRVYVHLTWNSTNYWLDPAFKVHEPISGITNLASAMGLDTNQLFSAAGGTSTADYVQSLDEANLRNKLKDYTTNLLGYLQSNYPNASVEEILGGQYVVSSANDPLNADTNGLPFGFTQTSFTNWDYIPTNLMTTLKVTVDSTTNRLLWMPQLLGQRLSLTFSTNGLAELWLEDDRLLQKQTSGGSKVDVVLKVDHPHGTWNWASNTLVNTNWHDHATTNAYQRTNASYALTYAFEADAEWLRQRQERLDQYRQQGLADTSREVTTETLNVMGLNWMLQTERLARVVAAQQAILLQHHHRLGRMAQEFGQGYYLDVYQQLGGHYPASGNRTNDSARLDRVFDLKNYFASAAEHGLIEQLQSSNLVAASTVKMLEIGNTNSQRTYLAKSSNWSGVQSNLSNYDKNFLKSTYIDQGYSLLLPADGSNQVAGAGTWAGYGIVARGSFTNAQGVYKRMDMLIKGGYHGGYVSDSASSLNPVFVAQINYSQPNYFFNGSALQASQFAADPVNLADGSFRLSATDLSLGQAAPRGLAFSRHYSPTRRHHNLAGLSHGWVHNYYLRAADVSAPLPSLGDTTPAQMAPLIAATKSAFELYSPTGNPKNWAVTALIAKWGVDQLINNAVSITLGEDSIQFIKQPNGTFTPPAKSTMALIRTNGVYWLQERHGNTFKFDTLGRLTNIVDQYNQPLSVSYDASGFATNITDWKNRTLTLTYSGTPQRLVSVTDSTGRTVSYGYTTNAGQLDLTSVTDAENKTNSFLYDTNHQIIATKDALNRVVTSNRYDGFGRVIEQYSQGDTNQTWKLSRSGYMNAEQDPAGGKRRFYYDDKHRLTYTRDALGHYTAFFYDGQDHLIETVSHLYATNDYFYDGRHNLVRTRDPLGYTNQFFYDSQDNLIRTVDPRGNTNRFGYNGQFQLTGSTNGAGDWVTFAYSGSDGTLTGRTDPGGTTSYAYDTLGQLSGIAYPGSLGSEEFLNSATGDVLSHTSARQFVTSFQYNARRELTNTIAPTNVTSKVAYDAVGNVQSTTDARGFATTQYWSATRKPTGTVLPGTPQGTPAVTNTYDARDWLLRTTNNPLTSVPATTRFTNDAAQRLISVSDPLNRTARFGYDEDNRKIAATNAANEITRQSWSQRSELTQVTTPVSTTIKRRYDAAGNHVTLTNRNGKQWQFQYDAANRLTNTLTPLNRQTSQTWNHHGLLATVKEPSGDTATLTYDPKGRLTNRTDTVGTIVYRYDANNNVTNIVENGKTNTWTFDAYDRVSSYTDAGGYQIQYRYDANGNLTNLIYPGNRTVTYAYDSLNRLTNVTDWANRKTTVIYDLASRVTSITRPNGTIRTNGYDAAGQLTNAWDRMALGVPVSIFTLRWDGAGRITNEFAVPVPHSNAPPSRTMEFDEDNRLKKFNGAWVTNDLDGNLTYGPLTNSTLTHYSYDARNRLWNAGGVDYGYDPAGNRITLTNGANVTRFVVNPNATLSQVLMRVRGGVTNYYIHGLGLLYQITETAASTNTATYHYDVRGSTVALTDANGIPTDRIEYSPYGMISYRAGTNDTPFLYNGRYGVQTDPNGLLHMRARYYSPYLCRFLNADPAGFGGGLNFYAYAGGNPVSMMDPFGLGEQNVDSGGSWFQQWKNQLSSALTDLDWNDRQAQVWAQGHPTPGYQMAADLIPFAGAFAEGGRAAWSGDPAAMNAASDRLMQEGVLTLLTLGTVKLFGTPAARPAVPNGSAYSVAFETRLSPASYPGLSRTAHFQEANGALLGAMEGDAQFAQIMQQGGVNLQRTATGLAPRTPPPGWTWHHAPESGVMQLVPRTQHAPGSIFQNTLHPGGQGGYSIWGQ